MKRTIFLLSLCAVFCANIFAAGKKESATPLPESRYSYEYREVAQKLKGPGAPFEKDGLIVFSAEAGPHYVGIVFDFENYQKIHPFHKKITYDENNNQESSWYFYILEDCPKTDKILYRLIIDGLWTTDPLNDQQHYDVTTGITLSKIDVKCEYELASSITSGANGSTAHFVYKGASGQKVRLAGTFTKWDSWIYELKETSRGIYELDLPLPRGTYYYVYYIGTNCFHDITNHERAIKDNGQPVSKLVIN